MDCSGRRWLYVKAVTLRFLMRIGMFIHGFPRALTKKPSFYRTVTPTTSTGPGKSPRIPLAFYVPADYERERGHGKLFPVVVNFHGGGFALGSGTDDWAWIEKVVAITEAVVVSVDYRLAPEHPFPTAVDDGVDALRYLEDHADELALDVSRVVLTGFSSGGNLVFTVPYRLYYGRASNMSLADLSAPNPRQGENRVAPGAAAQRYFDSPPSTSGTDGGPSVPPRPCSGDVRNGVEVESGENDYESLPPTARDPFDTPTNMSTDTLSRKVSPRVQVYPVDHQMGSFLSLPSAFSPDADIPLQCRRRPNSRLRIIGIFSWYPLLDFVLPRSLRRNRSANPSKTLAPFLTTLFDESYAPCISDRYSPFASPGRASEEFIRDALPQDIYMFICQWDMLYMEAQELVSKMQRMGKQVRSTLMERTTHAWDKSVNPFRDKQSIDVIYESACWQMRRLLMRDERAM
ncbi:hypothetical protein KEM52_000767 [Ascosphaera acerosa]|nr:hypothetical protein KEM52_000767 [Ascosphaera acerosa]